MKITVKADQSELAKILDGVVGAVIANRFEQHALWEENQRYAKRSWSRESMGIMETVGEIGDMPVCVALSYVTIDGHKILFVDPTSRVVDYEMIRQWMEKVLPVTAFEDNDPRKRLNTTDPTNFCNLFSGLKVAA